MFIYTHKIRDSFPYGEENNKKQRSSASFLLRFPFLVTSEGKDICGSLATILSHLVSERERQKERERGVKELKMPKNKFEKVNSVLLI